MKKFYLIGEELSSLRKNEKLSIKELSEKSGLSETHLERIETDRYPLRVKELLTLLYCMGYELSFIKKVLINDEEKVNLEYFNRNISYTPLPKRLVYLLNQNQIYFRRVVRSSQSICKTFNDKMYRKKIPNSY